MHDATGPLRFPAPDLHPDQVLAGDAAAADVLAGGGQPLGVVQRLTCHWTGAPSDRVFNAYHYNVRGDGRVVNTLPVTVKGSHTWGRNSNNIGLTLCAPGPARVTREQMEAIAKTAAELAIDQGLDLARKVELRRLRLVGDQLVPAPGIVMVPVLADHAFYAKADGYFPDRWDVDELLVIIRAKALWYVTALREGRHKFEHTRRG